jgi:hypothetical protein
VDVLLFGFHIAKVLQFGSFAAWYVAFGPAAPRGLLRGATRLQLVAGLQGVGLGQVLNAAIYKAIGKNGVCVKNVLYK